MLHQVSGKGASCKVFLADLVSNGVVGSVESICGIVALERRHVVAWSLPNSVLQTHLYGSRMLTRPPRDASKFPSQRNRPLCEWENGFNRQLCDCIKAEDDSCIQANLGFVDMLNELLVNSVSLTAQGLDSRVACDSCDCRDFR